tara:strand:+ start:1701 stop:2285 length:585 start_codon:yes stop_codon:yes gene_type:complete
MVNSYQNKMKEKIPIEITWMKNEDGILEPEIIIDAEDYVSFNTSIAEAILKFKKQYMKLLEKAQEILPEDKTKRKSSHFWQIGRLLHNFQKSVKNEFEIINFKEAISHDFQLYNTGQRRIDQLIQFGEFFSKKEIFDEISFALYQELIWKSTLLKKARIFEIEKKKLIKNAKEKKLLGNDRYRTYLKKRLESMC